MHDYPDIMKKDKICVMKFRQNTMNYHYHYYYEMVYILEGRIIHWLGDKKIEVQKGDYFIIDIKDMHRYEAYPNTECILINCLFFPEFIDSTLKYCRHFSLLIENYLIKFDESILKVNPTTYLFHDDTGEILELLMKINKESIAHKHGYTELMRCNLIEILITTMRKIIDDNKVVEKNGPTEYIIKYVGNNYMRKITLSEISRKLNYSLPYISIKFKEDTGFLFSEYLQKKRIDESCRLLANTKRKINDIAAAVGYEDVKFFTVIFKKYMHTTPAAFRRLQYNEDK